MKVQMVGVRKQFGTQMLFNDINYTFPEKGLVAVLGPSGCGKTTLLRMLAGLEGDYFGSIRLGTFSLNGSSKEERSAFRLEHLGFVFQDFRLLNMDTVEANVFLPYLPFHHIDKIKQKRLLAEMLHWVGLDGFEKRIVNTLSGGEKQRVSLARALVNDPSIVFADEPTGALDKEHGEQVLGLLKRMSSSRLVLVVTHDESLAQRYADVLLRIENGKLTETILEKPAETSRKAIFPHHPKNKGEKKLPLSWSVAHAKGNLKQKKWRTAMSQMALGMSLVGVGLSLALSSTISSRIGKALTSLLGEESIVMTPSEKMSPSPQIDGAPIEEVRSLVHDYADYIDGVGVSYENNFEDMFQDANRLVLAHHGQKHPLPSFSMRLINDFRWLIDENETIYPFRPPKMENDEVVLGISFDDLKTMTTALGIKTSASSLSAYLENNAVVLSFELRNDEWAYEDEQLVTLIGFYLTENPVFVHDNPSWNEWFFEQAMRFPFTTVFSSPAEYPWTLRKVPFVHLKVKPEDFFRGTQNDSRFNPFVLERFRVKEHRSLCGDGLVCSSPRLQVYLSEKRGVEIGTVNLIRKSAPYLGHYVICSAKGYVIYPEALMAGFSQETFFASSPMLLEEVIDAVGVLSAQEQNQTFVLPSGILSGSFLTTGDEAVRLHPLPEKLLYGRYPKEVDEIIMSEKMAQILFSSSKKSLAQCLYIGSLLTEEKDASQTIHRTFGVVPLTIVGVAEGTSAFISQSDDWGIAFFRDLLGVRAFDLIPSSVAFSIGEEVNDDHLQRLHSLFPAYEFSNPSQMVSQSIQETTRYVSLVLLCLSGLGILISLLLLVLIIYLFLIENRGENELLLTLGFSSKTRRGFVMMNLAVLCGQTLLVSWVEMLALEIGLGIFLDKYFNVSGNLSVLPWPYLAMFAVTFFILAIVKFGMTFLKKNVS